MAKATQNLGMLLLAIFLVLTGLIPLLKINASFLPTVMHILAIAAGVLIFLKK